MPNLEPRRIIKFGKSSFVVSIPLSWVKENQLKKGDLIYLTKNGNGELIVFSKEREHREDESKIVIDVDKKDWKDFRREVLFSYVNGYNTIVVSSSDFSGKSMKVKAVLKDLVGMEVIEQNENEIVARDFMNPQEISVKKFLRRIDNCIMAMLNELEKSIEKGSISASHCNEIQEMDENLNQFYFFIWRLNRKSLSNPYFAESLNMTNYQLADIWWIAVNMEHIGDNLKEVACLLTKTKLNSEESKKLMKIFSSVKDTYTNSIKAYYNNDKPLAYTLDAQHDKTPKFYAVGESAAVAKIVEKFRDIQGLSHGFLRVIFLNNKYLDAETINIKIVLDDQPGALHNAATFLYENDFNIIESRSRTLAKGQTAIWEILASKPQHRDTKKILNDMSSLPYIKKVEVEDGA